VLGLLDASMAWYAPDSVQFGGHYNGPVAVGEFFSKLPENYAELHVEPSAFIDRADAAGAAFDIPFVHVWTLGNGKATSFTEYFDTVKMNVALGLVAQPGAPKETAAHV
jgi:hypothetical protein